MPKPAALFVPAAMAVTAACVAAIVTVGLGAGAGAGALAGFAALAGMAVVHLAFVRPPGQALDQERLDDLDRAATEMRSRIETLDVRLSTLDAAVAERARAASRPLVQEMAALGGLVTSVAKEVAAHEAALAKLAPPPPVERPAPIPAPRPAPPLAAPEPLVQRPLAPPVIEPTAPPAPAAPIVRPPAPRIAAPEKPQAPEPFDPEDLPPAEAPAVAAAPDRGLAARVELALRDDRIDLYLQPVVALPNRRVAHYECLSRLREPDGLVLPAEFLPAATREGFLPEIDRRAIERAARVAGRLAGRGRALALFVNIAAETLADERVFREIVTRLEADEALARLLVLEMAQAAFESLGPIEREARDALVGRGLRFAIDHVTDLRLDPRDLARRGVRFVKVEARLLLDPGAGAGAAIHPSDLANLLSRHGLDLVATHVEDERTVPEMLDLDVKAAQGFLFGVPRPVRAGAAEGEAASPETRPRPFAAHPFVRRA